MKGFFDSQRGFDPWVKNHWPREKKKKQKPLFFDPHCVCPAWQPKSAKSKKSTKTTKLSLACTMTTVNTHTLQQKEKDRKILHELMLWCARYWVQAPGPEYSASLEALPLLISRSGNHSRYLNLAGGFPRGLQVRGLQASPGAHQGTEAWERDSEKDGARKGFALNFSLVYRNLTIAQQNRSQSTNSRHVCRHWNSTVSSSQVIRSKKDIEGLGMVAHTHCPNTWEAKACCHSSY